MMPVDAAQASTPSKRFTTKSIVDRAAGGRRHHEAATSFWPQRRRCIRHGDRSIRRGDRPLLGDARVIAPPLGVADVSRDTGIYNIPVPARPAAPFTLVPRHPSTGDGSAYIHLRRSIPMPSCESIWRSSSNRRSSAPSSC